MIIPEIKPEQSIELLKELHILTRDGKINQDSRRKLKQIYHLYQFIEPYLQKIYHEKQKLNLVDHGAGKSYLGFILYDLFFKKLENAKVWGIENREELVSKSITLAQKLRFTQMKFLAQNINESTSNKDMPNDIDIVTALHACDTATDDAIDFALEKKARVIVIIPCCQAEVYRLLKSKKQNFDKNSSSYELFRHPLHNREFGSHLTNVLRTLYLESQGYKVTVTELVGFEHSLKNELIIAELNSAPVTFYKTKLINLLKEFQLLDDLKTRFRRI